MCGAIKQDETFQILKEKLCNAPVLALLDRPDDFVVYCDASKQGFGSVLMQRGKAIAYASRLLKKHEKNYTTHDLELGTMVFTLKIWRHYLYGTKNVIYTGPQEFPATYLNHVRKLIMDEAHTSRYSVHPGADMIVSMIGGLVLVAWYEERAIVTLTKSAHFLPIREDYKTKKLAKIYTNEIVARHGVPEALGTRLDMSTAYHPQTDDQSERTIQTLEDMLRACVMDFGGSWDTHLPLIDLLDQKLCKKRLKRLFKSREMIEEMARSRQKSYADKRRKPLEFKMETECYLRLMKNPRFVEERDVKKLVKREESHWSKFRWNSQQGSEYTGIAEDQFKKKLSNIFS
ncbi:putative reverse transcriptase domain-containing protein [Tanacetum coccineum]